MSRFQFRKWFILLPFVVLLSACGSNLAGEPKIKNESEINLDQMQQGGQSTPVSTGQPGYDLGMQVFLSECASCHGAQDGTGPGLGTIQDNAASRVPGETADQYIRESIVNPSATIVPGYSDGVMPQDYGTRLSSDQIDSLVTFIEQFVPPGQQPRPTVTAAAQNATAVPGGTEQATPPQAVNATPAVSGDTFTVHGTLIQGTSGGSAIQAGQDLQLYVLDARQSGDAALIGTFTTKSDENSQFAFQDVPRNVHYDYIIQANYGGVVQGAHVPTITGTESDVTADITLYDTTTDTSSVMIMWTQVLFNYGPIKDQGLEVRLDLVLMNTGDQIVISDEMAPNGWPITVKMELPPGAVGIQPIESQPGSRYDVELENNVPVVKDTWPLRPKQEQDITVLYYLPYNSDAVIDHAFNYPVVGGAVLLPNDKSMKFESDQFSTQGQFRYRTVAGSGGLQVQELTANEKISPKSDASLVKEFDLINPLEANQHMIFTLSGRPSGVSGSSDSSPIRKSLPFILGGTGFLAILIGGLLYWRQRTAPLAPAPTSAARSDAGLPPVESIPNNRVVLMQAIADLDDAYEAGQIDEATYHERREALKARLLPLMDEGRHD